MMFKKLTFIEIGLAIAALAIIFFYVAVLVWSAIFGHDLYAIAKDFQIMGAAAVALTGAMLAYIAQTRKIEADLERDNLIAMNVAGAVLVEIQSVAAEFTVPVINVLVGMKMLKPDKFRDMFHETLLPSIEGPVKRVEATTVRLWPMLERCHPSRHKEISDHLSHLDHIRGWCRLVNDEKQDPIGWMSAFAEKVQGFIISIDPQAKTIFDTFEKLERRNAEAAANGSNAAEAGG